MLSSQKSTQSKILDFIKYHNGFVLGLVLALFGGAAIFAASPEAREAVLGKEIVTQTGIDNGALLAADLGNFDFQMKIENVGEDDSSYYVDYSFQTLEIQNNVWQTAKRRASMKIDKYSLAGEDLGLYVQKQLAQIAQNERDYLQQAQNAEKEKGPTQIARTTAYTGLIGLVLDAKNAILPGYDPVVKPAPAELAQSILPEPEPENLPGKEDNNDKKPAGDAGAVADGRIVDIVTLSNATTTEDMAESQDSQIFDDGQLSEETAGEPAEEGLVEESSVEEELKEAEDNNVKEEIEESAENQ